MKNPFKNSLKKCFSGILAAAMSAGLILAGSAGIASVQAAEDKALALPIEFVGVSDGFDTQGESRSRLYFDNNAYVTKLSSNYTYSCIYYIPQAAFDTPGAAVHLESWFNVGARAEEEGQEDTYLGDIETKYYIALVHEKGQIRFSVQDKENDWNQVEDNVYGTFLSLDTAGDFYKVTVQDAPLMNFLNTENGEAPLDTSRDAYININTSLYGVANEITSIAYVDDVVLKGDGNTVVAIDCSDESLENHYYDYVIAEKDESCVQCPAATALNTSLLKLSKTSGSVKVKKTLKINATAAADGTITYKSSDKKIATVDKNGKIKGVKAGTATITVSANSISKTFKVTVKK